MRLLLAALVVCTLPLRAHAQEDEDGDAAEAESETAVEEGAPGIRYTADLDDGELLRLWKEKPAELGSISVGFADQGRLLNPVHMPAPNGEFICQRPDLAWGTQETVDSLVAAFRAVHLRFPASAPARLSNIGAHDGGYLRPHKSHQSGRDADIGFFYTGDRSATGRTRVKLFDRARNWALIRALVTLTDVQVILVDRSYQKILREYALAQGEDREWVDRIFRAGKASLMQHAKKHKDHFHVRFYAPRSQELGRRIQPLLAERPEQNLLVHRVRRGQTLGHIAKQYGVTVAVLRKVNRLRGVRLALDQRVMVPLRHACTHCPVPPPVVIPPRCLPPTVLASEP